MFIVDGLSSVQAAIRGSSVGRSWDVAVSTAGRCSGTTRQERQEGTLLATDRIEASRITSGATICSSNSEKLCRLTPRTLSGEVSAFHLIWQRVDELVDHRLLDYIGSA